MKLTYTVPIRDSNNQVEASPKFQNKIGFMRKEGIQM